jgi:hypothetical protein
LAGAGLFERTCHRHSFAATLARQSYELRPSFLYQFFFQFLPLAVIGR